jgi:transcriptional regulator GlxA family with amidase domain
MRWNVAIVVFDEVEVLDFAGPYEVFATTKEDTSEPPFNVYLVAEEKRPINARNRFTVVPQYTFGDCPPPHIVVVPGGYGTRAQMKNPVMLDWLKAQNQRVDLMTSVCTGSLVLGSAGLLDGLKATTHHSEYDLLAKVAPSAVVKRGVRFVDNGAIITSAGVQAGMDMALHVVGRLCGEETALATAQNMEYLWQPQVVV